MTRRLAALMVAAFLFAAITGSAFAHAELVTSDPADRATITTPYTLTATFAQAFDPAQSSLIVENSAGTQVASGTVNPDDPTQMKAQLPALPAGAYAVLWTTVTLDDNGIERGNYVFNVGESVATPAPSAPPADGAGGSSSDLLIAMVLAAIAIIVVIAFVFVRGRR